MAKIYPEKFDFDTRIVDALTDALELLLEAYEKGAVSIEGFAGGVKDLIILIRNVPRSVTIDVGERNA